MAVKVLCTTDDPADSLEWHAKLAAEDMPFCTLPSFRPDRFLHIDQAPWMTAIAQLGEKYGVNYLISDFKKKNGYKRSVELSKEYGLYRQDYCGCVYSMTERKKQKNGENYGTE